MYFLLISTQGIIKEEELERIDQIVKEDGWVQDDEIDYNQKLVFSDDDSDTPPTTSRNKDAKRVNFNDKEARAQREMEMRAGEFYFKKHILRKCETY